MKPFDFVCLFFKMDKFANFTCPQFTVLPFRISTTPKQFVTKPNSFPQPNFFQPNSIYPTNSRSLPPLQIPNPTPPCHGHAGYRPRAGTLHAALAPGRCRCQRGGSDRRRGGSRAKSPRMRAGNTAATDWRWKASWFSQQ